MPVEARERHMNGCLCCGSSDLQSEYSIVSPYLAHKAFDSAPEVCQLHRCRQCDFRFYDRGLTDAEGDAYYAGYRNEAYYKERHRHEPFYTRREHEKIADRLGSRARRADFARTLAAANVAPNFAAVIDYGGGEGSLIAELTAERKISFDPSGTAGLPGVEVLGARLGLPEDADLITCAQVLEHVSDPGGLLDDMIALVRPGGLVYLEVPDQRWRRLTSMTLGRRVAEWLCRYPRALLAADIFGTAFRVKFGVLPPFAFVPMREHINFFSADSLRALVQRDPTVTVRYEGRAADNSFCLIAEKSVDEAQAHGRDDDTGAPSNVPPLRVAA